MKILLTGATGYIGKRLLPVLIENGHQVVCCVRDRNRFSIPPDSHGKVSVIEVDFLDRSSLTAIPEDIDVAYYLIHSMTATVADFDALESRTASHFQDRMNEIQVRQVIYLSGIVNDKSLSKHLDSRKAVERILASGQYPLTTLRAGIIIGSGSASFEIMRDLVEKLPVMITPKWLKTKSQPIAIRDVIGFLVGVLMHKKTFGQSFDIGGPDILSYRQMLLKFAEVRNLKRYIFTVPVMTPRLSSYWLFFVTSVSFPLAVNLVDSMKVEVIGKPNDLPRILGIEPLNFESALQAAFKKIEQNEIVSSWKDSLISSTITPDLGKYIQVPMHGCFQDTRKTRVADSEATLDRMWSLGGDKGWYYANWLWKIRGWLDKLVGGVGLRRGRTHPKAIQSGDALDFWRVLLADRPNRRLLLFAEMKLPGEAWLEFKIDQNNVLHQTATFRPKGLFGRFYWYCVMPLHHFVFTGMISKLVGK